jgi:Mg-chelatase subunit ChlD
LDAAASGWNIVEREGISVSHPSRFILVGTMNPEEGELRPQILDRFGVYGKTLNLEDPVLRSLVIQRNEEFMDNPSIFIKKNWDALDKLRRKIEKARELLLHVEIHQEIFSAVASVCSGLRVDGFRPDIAAMKVARALAAYEGREAVGMEDVTPSMELALGHRTRSSGLAPPPSKEQIQKALKKARRKEYNLGISASQLSEFIQLPKDFIRTMMRSSLKNLVTRILLIALMAIPITLFLETFRSTVSPLPSTPSILFINGFIGGMLSLLLALLLLGRRRRKERAVRILDLSKITLNTESQISQFDKPTGTGTGAGSAKVRYGKGFTTTPEHGPKILRPMERLHRRPTGTKLERICRPLKGSGYNFGTRRKTISTLTRGRSAWHQLPKGRPRDIALVPTLRAAALFQQYRREEASHRIIIKPEDIRVRVREYRPPYSILLLVDMSMSMINSIDNLIRAIYSLHGRVYRRRDRVGLVVFKGSKAFTLQHPTMNLDLVVRKLREVGASDFTPMAAGLLRALKVLKHEKMRNRDAVLNLIIFSDGIVNVPLETPLSPLSRRRYYSEAQADSIDVAHLLSKEKLRVHIINTNHVKEDAETPFISIEGWRLDLTPTQFLMELSRASKGNYYGLSIQDELAEEMVEEGEWFYTQYSL